MTPPGNAPGSPDDLRKVNPGDPLRLPAGAYNAFVDAALANRAIPNEIHTPFAHGPTIGSQIVIVRNDTTANIPRFGVMGIGGPLIDPSIGPNSQRDFKNAIAFNGVDVADVHIGKYILLLEPLAKKVANVPDDPEGPDGPNRPGAIGRGLIRGVTPAIINVNHADHTHCEVVAGSNRLQSGFEGSAMILWKAASGGGGGTGEQLAVIDLGPPLHSPGFDALITGYQAMAGETNRFEYSWKEAIWDSSAGLFIPRPGGRSSNLGTGDFDDPAYNRIENANDGLGVESGGVDVEGVSYPNPGFALRPIRGSTGTSWTDALAPAVWMQTHVDDEGNRRRIFQVMNVNDGTCP